MLKQPVSDRPDPPFPLPPDRPEWYWKVEVDPEWQLWEPGGSRTKCRGSRYGCPNTPVAELWRPRWRGQVKGGSWWAYCGDHLYGRWIEDGKIVGWRVRKDADAAS